MIFTDIFSLYFISLPLFVVAFLLLIALLIDSACCCVYENVNAEFVIMYLHEYAMTAEVCVMHVYVQRTRWLPISGYLIAAQSKVLLRIISAMQFKKVDNLANT